MSAPLHESGAGHRGASPRTAAVGVVLALGLLVAVIWLVGGSGETPDAGGDVVAVPQHAAEGSAHVPPAAPTPGAGAPQLALPEARPEKVAPLEAGSGVPVEEWRDIRGSAVRASDGSPVWSATIIAMKRDVALNGMAERAQAQTDADGNFVLHMPQGVETFRARIPAPGRSRDAPPPTREREVEATAEWEGGNATASTVRLVLETGWRLDLTVLDGAGSPRAGVRVNCAGYAVTSDADGRCALLDLPVGEPSVTLGLQSAPGAKSSPVTVQAPEAGRLVREAQLTLP